MGKKQQPQIERLSSAYNRMIKAVEKIEEEFGKGSDETFEFWESEDTEAAYVRNMLEERLLQLAHRILYVVKCKSSNNTYINPYVKISTDAYIIEVVFPNVIVFDISASEKLIKEWLRKEGLLSEFCVDWLWVLRDGDLVLGMGIEWCEGDSIDTDDFICI